MPASSPDGSPASHDETIDQNGIDRTQIRDMLRLTPEQRLARVEEFLESVQQIRALNEELPVR